jgi:UDP-glucose 4-epimerase
LPVTIDNLSTGYRQAVKWGPLHETDIRDEAVIAALIGQYRSTGRLGPFTSPP